jgi:D-sedoheptulose 7-phosphate isomerase
MQEIEATIEEIIKEHRDAIADLERKIPDIIKIRDVLIELIRRDGLLLLCGNGGSAADSMHWAAEWRVRFKKDRRALRAETLTTDTSTLTATGNDLGFEWIFSRQVEAVGRKGDVLILISTSGNSENIIRAIEAAKKEGIFTIGLGGKDGGRMAKLVDLPFIIDSPVTARIQEMHELTMHILCELVDQELEAEAVIHG